MERLIINFNDLKETTNNLDPSKGRLLLFMHTPNLDFVVRAASLFMPVSGMARPQSNKIVDNLFKASRKKFTERIFDPKEILELLNYLKIGKTCLYAPDQDYGYKNSIFVNFFDSSDGKLNVDKYSSIISLAPSCAICAAACNFFVSNEL